MASLRRPALIVVGLLVASGATGSLAHAQAPTPADPPTIASRPCWADELFFQQWRIQRHLLNGRCRLLDDKDRTRASGTFEQCQEALERAKRSEHLPPMHGPVVLLLHGLFRSRDCMRPLGDYLEKQGGYLVLNVEYPSTQLDIARHAQSLASIVSHLEGVEEVDLVGHSLGNIIIRRWLADRAQNGGATGPRLGRIVMLGPPNQGAELATLFADEPLFRMAAGSAGQQLGPQWPWLAMTLATPPCEFAIIAGGRQDDRGFNPLLPGDDDGTVTVESTRLEGAKDFWIVPTLHSFLMSDKRVQAQTLTFLQQGHFQKPE